ncbi:MAG TPA: arabinofuranosidase catalytic domain-containing protein [Polyangiaceae bacterium]|nr:arabinofuranosidase catalytic domain-containing protein [Polyangiaceae bacterium]
MRSSSWFSYAVAIAALIACGQSPSTPPPEHVGGSSATGAGGASDSATGGSHSAGTLSVAGDAPGGTPGIAGTVGGGGSNGSAATAGTGNSPAQGGRGGASAHAGAAGTAGNAGSGAVAGSGGATTTSSGPCDVYAAGNTPCIAAHSTIRALSGSYDGKLYQVRRASDKTTKDIAVLNAGGFADSAAQDTFCDGTTCTISILYDQSGKANHLTVGPAGGAGKADVESNATALKLKVGGHSVYGVFIAPGNGYRNNKTTGIATGNDAQGAYMVTSGKHVNDGCCFDYGNAETNNKDTGNGHMEAIYVGKLCWFPPCNGAGPWVMADLENGLFSGANGVNDKNTSVPYEYLTAMLKGHSSGYAIKAGNAQSGTLTTMYDGALPTKSGYSPMHLEGAIILGVGGDNSNASAGTFFEGAMTSGFPTQASDDAVQANIVAASYGK